MAIAAAFERYIYFVSHLISIEVEDRYTPKAKSDYGRY